MHEHLSSDETARQAVLARFGITAESKDYNLDRIVRVAALGMGCSFGVFTLFESGHHIRISSYGETHSRLPNHLTAADRVAESGQPLFVDDIEAAGPDSHWTHSAEWAAKGAYACRPVFASATTVIGALTVISPTAKTLDTPEMQRVMLDCVRLLEDSLTMRQDSIHDPLTGLYNRRFFEDQVTAEWQRARRLKLPISMLVIDVDHFKDYNDSQGHLAGDRALTRVADLLKREVRRSGDTICRYGGEEFAMILSATPLGDAIALAGRVCSAIEQAAIQNPGPGSAAERLLTISVGVSAVDFGDDSVQVEPRSVLNMADQALYAAKAEGRNCVRHKIANT